MNSKGGQKPPFFISLLLMFTVLSLFYIRVNNLKISAMPKIKLSKISKVIKFIKKVFKSNKDPKSAYTKDI